MSNALIIFTSEGGERKRMYEFPADNSQGDALIEQLGTLFNDLSFNIPSGPQEVVPNSRMEFLNKAAITRFSFFRIKPESFSIITTRVTSLFLKEIPLNELDVATIVQNGEQLRTLELIEVYLSTNSLLKVLSLTELTTLNLKGSNINDDAGLALAKMVENASNLKKLVLTWCGLSSKTATHLAVALKKRNLEVLDLDQNWRISSSIGDIAESLMGMDQLKSLYLREITLDEKGVISLSNLIRTSTRLKDAYFKIPIKNDYFIFCLKYNTSLRSMENEDPTFSAIFYNRIYIHDEHNHLIPSILNDTPTPDKVPRHASLDRYYFPHANAKSTTRIFMDLDFQTYIAPWIKEGSNIKSLKIINANI